MTFISEWILQAVDAVGCNITALNERESIRIRTCIEEKYAGKGLSPLWERLNDTISEYNPEGWRGIGVFPIESKIIMFFDKNDETTMYLLNNGSDLVALLSECPGFIFYITDDQCNFILCHNDHDYLIVTGIAKNWIKN